jgi:hypothetical protein
LQQELSLDLNTTVQIEGNATETAAVPNGVQSVPPFFIRLTAQRSGKSAKLAIVTPHRQQILELSTSGTTGASSGWPVKTKFTPSILRGQWIYAIYEAYESYNVPGKDRLGEEDESSWRGR